jgi:tetratricopeptide (TPR) repeat protein
MSKGKQNKVIKQSSGKPLSNNNAKNPSPRRIIVLGLAILACVLYLNTLNHNYAFDDSVAITDNQFTKQGIKGIPKLLTQDFFAGIYDKGLELGGGRYRPLSLITFAIEYQFFGANPFIGHLINMLLYALTIIVLFKMLEEIFPVNFWLCAIASALFAAHPIHTEVVANIKSRDEILSFIFLCLTLMYLFRYLRVNKKSLLIYSLVSYFLSLLAKENGMTFIAIIPLTIFCFTDKNFKQSVISAVPFFIIAIVYFVIRTSLVGIIGDRDNPDIMENPFVNASLGDKYATIIHILGKYLWMLFYPNPLSCDYSFNQIPIISFGNVKAIFPLIVYLVLGVYATLNIKKKNIVAYCILFYLFSISIVSNIVFNIGAPMGERFLFLPSLAFCIVIAHLGLKLFKSPTAMKPNKLFLAIVIFVLGIYSFKTFSRNKDWKDNETLFSADAKTVPNSAKIRYYYGNTLLNHMLGDKANPDRVKKLTIALNEVNASIAINPKFHHAYYAKGMICQELGMADSAIAAYNNVLKLQPTHINTQSALGTVYGKMKGDFDNAIKYLTVAVKYNPKDGSAYENLGIAYAMKKDFNSSLKAFEQALKLKPESAQSYLNIAITYQNMGNKQKADEFFEKAFKIDPSLKQAK